LRGSERIGEAGAVSDSSAVEKDAERGGHELKPHVRVIDRWDILKWY